MSPFAFHRLNPVGQKKSKEIAEHFETLLTELEYSGCGTGSREFAIAKTKLEEACFFAKKSMAVLPENQEKES